MKKWFKFFLSNQTLRRVKRGTWVGTSYFRKISRGGSVLLHLLEKQGRYVIFDVKVPGGYNMQWAKKKKNSASFFKNYFFTTPNLAIQRCIFQKKKFWCKQSALALYSKFCPLCNMECVGVSKSPIRKKIHSRHRSYYNIFSNFLFRRPSSSFLKIFKFFCNI